MPERLIDPAVLGALAAELLQEGSFFQFQAHGGSMRPFIYNGETLELEGVRAEQLRRGDILLCWLGQDRLILHRLVAVRQKEGRRFLTLQGDAFGFPDGTIPQENVIGRVRAIRRGGKWLAVDGVGMRFLARLWLFTIPLRRMAARGWARLVGRKGCGWGDQ